MTAMRERHLETTRDVPAGSVVTQAKGRNETFDDGGGI